MKPFRYAWLVPGVPTWLGILSLGIYLIGPYSPLVPLAWFAVGGVAGTVLIFLLERGERERERLTPRTLSLTDHSPPADHKSPG